MTEEERKELLDIGFGEVHQWLCWRPVQDGPVGIDIHEKGSIYFADDHTGIYLCKFKSVDQVRRKMKGVNLLWP